MQRTVLGILIVMWMFVGTGLVYAVDVQLSSGDMYSGEIIGYDDDEFSIETIEGVYGFPYEMVEKITSAEADDQSIVAINQILASKQKKTTIYQEVDSDPEIFSDEQGVNTVEIFVTSWCPHCTRLEEFLQQNNIEFRKYDIELSTEAGQMHQQMGGGGIPVTKIGSKVIRGYDPNGILAALNRR